jgi:hypothetical protein
MSRIIVNGEDIPDKELFNIFRDIILCGGYTLNLKYDGIKKEEELEWGKLLFFEVVYQSWTSPPNSEGKALELTLLSGISEEQYAARERSEIEVVSLGVYESEDIECIERHNVNGKITMHRLYESLHGPENLKRVLFRESKIKDPRPWLERLITEYFSS